MIKNDLTYILQTIKSNHGNCHYAGGICFHCEKTTNFVVTEEIAIHQPAFWRCDGCGSRTRITKLGFSRTYFTHPQFGPLGSVIEHAFQKYNSEEFQNANILRQG